MATLYFPSLSRTKNEAEQRREAAGRRSKNRDSFRGALKIEDEREGEEREACLTLSIELLRNEGKHTLWLTGFSH